MMKSVSNSLQPKDLKLYEQKQYKKGLKQTDKLLETLPNHPETNSMKGLFLFLNDRQEEGFALAKQAVTKNLKSEICWHIFGIINRNMRNYAEAVRCYKQALKLDPENIQILKDMAMLQVQIRDLEGHYDTRFSLLNNKPNLALNWLSFAVSAHLKEDYDETFKILESTWKTLSQSEMKPYEKSELLLYEGSLYREAKRYKELITHLEKNDKLILDRPAFQEMLVEAYINLNDSEKAIPIINAMIKSNPENYNYHDLLQRAKKINSEDLEAMGKLFNELVEVHKGSSAIKCRRLGFLSGEAFREAFTSYVIPYYQKGLPSLFSEIKYLYRTSEKVQIMEEQLVLLEKSLREDDVFPGSKEESNPCCLLWAYMLLAQHFDRAEKYELALDYIEKAINHTPTLVELYLVKAKIFKHLKDFEKGQHSANIARGLDLADRYLNNKAIKYCLFNDQTEEAESLIKLFMRDENVHELQTMWYEIELGKAFLRKKEYGSGLRQFKFIEKHFQDMYEDQFDFHVYCLRKYTLRVYVDMIRYQDNLYKNKFFIKASTNMINALLEYDVYKKKQDELKLIQEQNKQALTAGERKKLKKEQERREKLLENDPNSELKKKLDLDGSKYLSELKSIHDEANKFATKLINITIENPRLARDAYVSLVNFYTIREKFPLALKSLKRLIKLQNHSDNVKQITFFLHNLSKHLANASNIVPEVRAILEEERNGLSEVLKKSFSELEKGNKFTHAETDLECQFLNESINKECYLLKLSDLYLNNDSYKISDAANFYGKFIAHLSDNPSQAHLEKKEAELEEKFKKLFPLSSFLKKKEEPNNEIPAAEGKEKV